MSAGLAMGHAVTHCRVGLQGRRYEVVDPWAFGIDHAGTAELSKAAESAAETEVRSIAVRIGEDSRV